MLEYCLQLYRKLSDRQYCLLSAGIVFLICLPVVVLDKRPFPDVMMYYAPMMRELGAGNWSQAFYPRIPPLFILSGAPFVWLGMDGYVAAKATSSLYLALSVFPLFLLMKRVFGRPAAALSVWLMVLFPSLLSYSSTGLRESAKIFYFLVIAYGLVVFLRERKWWPPLLVCLGVAGLSLTWGGGLGVGVVAFAILLVTEMRHPQGGAKMMAFPFRTLLLTMLLAIVLAPWIAYVYRCSGYPVTDMRHSALLDRLGRPLDRLGLIGEAGMPDDAIRRVEMYAFFNWRQHWDRQLLRIGHADPDRMLSPEFLRREPTGIAHIYRSIINEIINGLGSLYLMIGIGVIIWRVRHGRWLREELLLAGLVVSCLLLMVVTIGWLNVRYVVMVAPLILGWAACGILSFGKWIRTRFSSRVWQGVQGATVIVVLVCLYNGTDRLWQYKSEKQRDEWQAVHVAADWISEEGEALVPAEQEPLHSTLINYHSGRTPVIMCENPAVAYYAGGDYFIPRGFPFNSGHLIAYCQIKQVNFIFTDKRLVSRFPILSFPHLLPEEFVILLDLRGESGNGAVLLGFAPNLRAAPRD